MRLRPALVLLLALAATPGLAGPSKTRAVVELFTSQGCSSCPPADKLAAELAQDPALIVLSLPVDYWDYLGWKDTLASKVFTARQKAYGEARGDRQVYTPQAVIDGAVHVVGSDRKAIDGARAARPRGVPVQVEAEDTGPTLRIRVAAGASPGTPATVLILPLRSRCEVSIARGENKGKVVTYTNVVRDIVAVGMWDGHESSFEVPSSLLKQHEADGFVVLLQAGSPDRPGPILGAARSPGL